MTLYKRVDEIVEQLRGEGIKLYASLGLRWWTRGDGSRYKQANELYISEEHREKAWDILNEMFPTAKKLEVREEFPSLGYHSAIVHSGIVFINRNSSIQYASASILRNDSVWHSRPRQTAP